MRQDDAYLLDMLVAARKATEFTRDLTYDQFTRSDLHQNAIFKVLEIVGEAASRVSLKARTANPEIPWHETSDCAIALCMPILKSMSASFGRS